MYAWGQQYFVSVKLVLHTKYGSFVEDHSASLEDYSSLETNSCISDSIVISLTIFSIISIYSNIQIYILQYNHDGNQKKKVMRLIRICFPLNKMVHSLKLYPVKINKNRSCIQTK